MKKWQRTMSMVTVAIGLAALGSGLSQAAGNPFQRGPDPTAASIEAERGPFAVTQAQVPAGNGFGGGTLTYPTDTGQGTFGAVAISPGFLSPESLIACSRPQSPRCVKQDLPAKSHTFPSRFFGL